MRALIIGPEQQQAVQIAKMKAHQNPINEADGNSGCILDSDYLARHRFSVEIPMGFMCNYSIEHQPFGWCHHLSIALEDGAPDRRPHFLAVETIMKEFGMGPLSGAAHSWDEAERNAVHVLVLHKELNSDLKSAGHN